MRLRESLAILPILLALGGCAETRVNSIPRAGFNQHLDRIYVYLSPGPEEGLSFSDDLKEELAKQFEQRHLTYKIRVKNILAVDESEKIQSDLEVFKPAYVFDIAQDSATSVNGGTTGAGFSLTITASGEQVPVWKAAVQCSGASNIGSPRLTVEKIFSALMGDGLLEGTSRP